MEVARNAVMKMRTLRPLPGEITNERIRDAALPLKIEAARNAIAKCTDLPELLQMKSQAEGLAAAVRVMKEVGPEMIRAANCLLADAWRKGGELLSQYSSTPSARPDPKNFKRKKNGQIIDNGTKGGGTAPSPRGVVMRELGIDQHEASSMVRIAAAPKEAVDRAVQESRHIRMVGQMLPRTSKKYLDRPKRSPDATAVMSLIAGIKTLCNRTLTRPIKDLAADERKAVKDKIVEIQELLDEMDRLCR